MNEASRRERILQVAERLFGHYGPGKTTMADIAREARVGVGSVYLDFPSKESILDELSRKKGRSVARMMESAAEGATSAERLRRMLEARVAALFILAGEGMHACDLVHCHSQKPASFDDEARRLVVSELELGVRGGELACEPEATARAIEVAFAALSPPYVFRFDRSDAVELAGRIAHLVVHGLAARALGSRGRDEAPHGEPGSADRRSSATRAGERRAPERGAAAGRSTSSPRRSSRVG
jgi:AcrR family transcriptional regulator